MKLLSYLKRKFAVPLVFVLVFVSLFGCGKGNAYENGELYGETKPEEQADQYLYPDIDGTAAFCRYFSVLQHDPPDEGKYQDFDPAESEAD